MARDLLMPKLGLTMSEATLLEWKVAPGDAVHSGQILYVIETDKVATEVEADGEGVFEACLVSEGQTVPVGTVVGRLAGSRGAAPRLEPVAVVTPAGPSPAGGANGRIIATPLARRLARQLGVELKTLAGSGPRGRIKAADVTRAAESVPAPATGGRRLKPTATQATMARRLAEAKHGIPHFYLSTEAELSGLRTLREALNADADRPRLTLTHFVLAAVGRALCDLPDLNRVWRDGELVAYDASDVGMAVETGRGLFVPVVRDAGSIALDAVAETARALAGKAKDGTLRSDEVTGGAVTVSNAGMHDVTWLTPIINPGQSAILGVGSVREIFRPDAAGAPMLRRELGLVLAADHRVHTGVEGVTFLNRIKAYLETPMRLLRPGVPR